MDNFDEILDKIKEREETLSKDPDIKKYQDNIDLALAGVENTEIRLHILMKLIIAKYTELLNACSNYYKEFLKIKDNENIDGIKFKDEFIGNIMWSHLDDKKQ